MKKRFLSLILVLCMVCMLFPMSVFAADVVDSNTCGANLTWTLDSDGKLTISGTGAMENYNSSYGKYSPWFSSTKIKSIVIDKGVTSIGDNAFLSCSKLESVTIPDSVQSIGIFAFANCKSLTSVKIPKGVTSIGDSAFANCNNLTSVTIPDGVTNIGNSAFETCSSLTSVMIPDSVTSIGNAAFAYCRSLASVMIPDSVTNIGISAFFCCDKLADKNGFVIVKGILYNYYGTDGEVIIPDGVTKIGEESFEFCNSVTSVTLPYGVTSIGSSAFFACDKLESVTIPRSVTSIGNSAFAYCSSLESVTIPRSVTSIGDFAFSSCSSLTSAKFEGSVPTTFGWEVFGSCADGFKILAPEGDTTWTNSTTYNSEAGTWNGYPIEFYNTGHAYTSVVTKPTCTEKGYTTYTCSHCGDSYKTDYVAALGHNYVAGVCTVCGADDPNYKPPVENPFVDLKAGEYYVDPVLWAASFKPVPITSGIDDTHFAPNVGCTRAQVVTFIWRAAGCPEPTTTKNPFVDVQNSGTCKPFYKAILWAAENGITNGIDDTHFAPYANVTRGQVVTFLYRYAKEPAPTTANNPFVDLKAGEYYINPILWAYENGITNGVDDTHFEPNTTVTRAQVVTFLYRYAA